MFELSLRLMLYGMGGVFAALAILYVAVKVVAAIPSRKEKPDP